MANTRRLTRFIVLAAYAGPALTVAGLAAVVAAVTWAGNQPLKF